jgi:tetratricopeptide (TPR) repeat protein
VFSAPYFSSFYSFFDSIYATFWGDSLLGGQLAYYNHPWNFEYVSAVYILSLPAALIIIIGLVRAAGAAIFRADKGWLFFLGLFFAAIWSTVYMNLRLPYNAQAKAFYSLFVVMPVALIFAFGFSGLDGWLRNKGLLPVRTVLYGWFGTLALAVFFSFFIGPAKPGQQLDLSAAAEGGKLDEAVAHYTKFLSGNPDSYYARVDLAISYALQDKYDDAIEQCMKAQQLRPDWPKTLNTLAKLLITKPNGTAFEKEQAVRYAERCCQLTGYLWGDSLFTLAYAYMAEGRASLAVETAEKALKEAEAREETELAETVRTWLQSVEPAQIELQKQP